MQGLDPLTWAVRALSLFDTIAFIWLGLAVLLNAQRRAPGTWVTGGGLLLAGLFFAVHSTLVGRELGTFDAELALWWPALWLLFVVPPYLWYVAIAWYAGVLGAGRPRARIPGSDQKDKIHLGTPQTPPGAAPWTRSRFRTFVAVTVSGVVGLVLPAVGGLLPTYDEIARGAPATHLTLGGVPVAVPVYPAYSALCFGLALAALRRPAASNRFMGDLGRRRAHPWLVAASLMLLAVGLSVGAVAVWLLREAQAGRLNLFSPPTLRLLMGADLAISSLLAVVVVLQGRAIVSYEIFTGKALPRGGLRRHWRNSLILAGGYGVLMGGSLALPVDPIYHLMLATLLVAVFYALLAWRSYAERERSMERLRPFVASQRLYEQLLAPAAPHEVEVAVQFRALCEEVLGARVAYLVALGPLAPLVGAALTYPAGETPLAAGLGRLAELFPAPAALAVPLDPSQFGGAVWAVPLWSERGLVGALLLGDKRDAGLYVQEEIEIARAAGERMIDTQASAEMARRLMAVQRQRLAETQLLDHRARRTLHDDILPRLHAALLTLSTADPKEGAAAETVEQLADVHRCIADLLRTMPASPVPEVARLGLIGALRQVVEGELAGAFDGVTWEIEPEIEAAARALPPTAAEVVFGAAREAIRNAARHGRDRDRARPLHLAISAAWQGGLSIAIEDDGVGLRSAATPAAGSGQGLALHGTMMAVLGGTLAIEAAPGPRTRVSLVLPQQTPLP